MYYYDRGYGLDPHLRSGKLELITYLRYENVREGQPVAFPDRRDAGDVYRLRPGSEDPG